ncbi:predicted protein [Chaetoceros tenuissimus]|uniref:Uncharacterized protein n=1 Tax=Chaetoceros tenuissimus TaxID=426638 RepID=A0AAD3CZP3_9STRA|nr:predicted protein [Chaetoceros tenuissimus]
MNSSPNVSSFTDAALNYLIQNGNFDAISSSSLFDPVLIAKLFTSTGLYCIYSLLTIEKSSKRFGFGLDSLSLDYCELILSLALSTCVFGYFTFFENRDPLVSVTLGRGPMFLYLMKSVLNWDSKYSIIHRGRKGKKAYFSLFFGFCLNSVLVYMGSSAAAYTMKASLTFGLLQGVSSMMNTSARVKELNGLEAAERESVLAMHRCSAMLTIQYCSFALGLVTNMKATRAYGLAILATLGCMLYKNFVLEDVKRNNFNKRESNFWMLTYAAVAARMLV